MPNNFTQAQRISLLGRLRAGRANAVGAKVLAQSLGFPAGGKQVQLRGLIKE